jgi:hypothetical protein
MMAMLPVWTKIPQQSGSSSNGENGNKDQVSAIYTRWRNADAYRSAQKQRFVRIWGRGQYRHCLGVLCGNQPRVIDPIVPVHSTLADTLYTTIVFLA